MNDWLDDFEKHLQEFFETQLQNLGRKNLYTEMTKSLLELLQEKIEQNGEKRFAPNIFRITTKHNEHTVPEDINAYSETLKTIIKNTCQDQGLSLYGPIHIQFFNSPKLEQEFKIEASFSSPPTQKTTKIKPDGKDSTTKNETATGYLISSSDEIFEIKNPITNIGRRDDNDLVIDNLLVSRLHAQIRIINGTHVLFDIDSIAGTKVNGRRIQQHSLRSGDVIEIADIALIYYREIDEKNSNTPTGFTRKIS